ncbi:MAG: hypothetical protein HPY75_11755 [Actinobacteria bacterium]|nr:hypothetical protein [Actinomycetota bacterium]
MKKSVAVSVLALAACLCLVALTLAACGGSGTAKLANPLDFFEQARKNMQGADSFRMSGKMAAEITGLDTQGASSLSVDYDMVYEQKGGEPLARMEISTRGPASNDMEAYIDGDRMYLQMPDGTWIYQEVGLTSELANMSQGMGPQFFKETLAMAENAKVVEEDAETITYDLTLDFDKMMQSQGEEELRQRIEELGIPNIDVDTFVNYLRELISEMEYRMTVDKKSGLVTRLQMHMDMGLSSFAEMMPGESIPEGARMVEDAEFYFSDYGESFDIELPPETKNAIPAKMYGKNAET